MIRHKSYLPNQRITILVSALVTDIHFVARQLDETQDSILFSLIFHPDQDQLTPKYE